MTKTDHARGTLASGEDTITLVPSQPGDRSQPTGDHFRMMVENITQLAWIAQADGWIYWYNRRWYEYTGTTTEQMAGWGWQTVHDPSELPRVLERWKFSIARAEPFDMVFPLLGADGVFRPFLTRITPVKDEHGKVLHWVGTNTDISEQLETERALRESEERFRSISASSPVGIFVADTEGKCIYTNPRCREICGFKSMEDSLGAGWSKHIHPDDRGRVAASWQQAVRNQSKWMDEFRWWHEDGRPRLSVGRAAPMLSDADEVIGFAGTVEDITQQRQAVVRLRSSEERLRIAQSAGKVATWEFQSDEDQLSLSDDAAKLLGLGAISRMVSVDELLGAAISIFRYRKPEGHLHRHSPQRERL